MSASVYDRQGRRKYLNRAENRRFLDALDGLPDIQRTFCLTLYYTGCRISEALNLTAEDLDYDEQSIKFRTVTPIMNFINFSFAVCCARPDPCAGILPQRTASSGSRLSLPWQ